MAESYRVEVVPLPVSVARICMWVQAGMGALGLALLLTLVGGMSGEAVGTALPMLAVPLAAILVIGYAAYQVRSRRRWVRAAGIVVESLQVLHGIWSLTGGFGVSTVLNVALALAVAYLLVRPESAAWFDRSAVRR
ncbi:hypothetical protein MF672_010255 [Actinomadura sp. ATCC 31491]|uniref:DUF2568 domain-containing protein n=1 Tax=Actinomadura luzonensis TaxID=2805427 RepID=A0ABT0FPH2_9ACTN|nr:hypothetical protein [Actinomadura luzonensis]MCK2214169.1 hypothetical protein [Actinomadura luzonensis]